MDLHDSSSKNMICIEIEDMIHRLYLIKYIKKNGKLIPKNSNSKFTIDSTNSISVGSQKLFKSEIVPSEGIFYAEMIYKENQINFEIAIEQDNKITNTLESYGTDYATSSQLLIKKKFTVKIEYDNADILLEIIEKSINESKEKLTKNLEIYYNRMPDCWSKLSELESVQSLSQIFLPSKTIDDLKTYLEEFISLKSEYKRFGISHKFTVLLEGKPGMGKSTISRAVAHYFNRRLYVLNLANRDMKESHLIELFRDIKPDSVLVLEDIDAFFVGRKTGTECATGVSFSTLINLLDGSLSSGNGLITFITANHAKNLDKALVRQGRIDKVIHFGDITKDQYDEAWKELVSKEEPPDEEIFRICRNNNLSMSSLMHIFFFGKTKEGMKNKAKESASERSFIDSGNGMYT